MSVKGVRTVVMAGLESPEKTTAIKAEPPSRPSAMGSMSDRIVSMESSLVSLALGVGAFMMAFNVVKYINAKD
jgi:hypothetical protein